MEYAVSEIIRIDREARAMLQKAEEERQKILRQGEKRRELAAEKAAALREEKLAGTRARAEAVIQTQPAREKAAD